MLLSEVDMPRTPVSANRKNRSAAAQKVDGDTGQDIVDLELEDDISQHIAAERPGQHARQKTEPCVA